ncbi:MAG: transketolase [Oscillospiraceae bacterium]|jgi:transketolase|nr:transketolase [Oscillospiraceae bacterium]
MHDRIRKQIFLSAYAGGIGHLASSFSSVEILSALYLYGAMKYDASDVNWEGRDYFILSKGHGALALYAVLGELGVISREALLTFCRPEGLLGGEPHAMEVPGIEASTGSLGHGLSVAVGIALALRMDGKPNHVYVLTGDGECQEGSIWEAVMSAAAYRLDNLTVIVDHNRIQKMDFIQNIMHSDALNKAFECFGWHVQTVDGHDAKAIKEAIAPPKKEIQITAKPRCIIAETVKGKGLSLMENNPAWHWRMPNRRELKTFMAELGITQEELDVCKKRI